MCHAQQRAVRQKAGRDSADMSVGVGFDILPWTSKVALVFALAFGERRWQGLEAAKIPVRSHSAGNALEGAPEMPDLAKAIGLKQPLDLCAASRFAVGKQRHEAPRMQGFAPILDRAEDTAPATRPLQPSRDAAGRAFLHEPRRLDMHRHGASGRSKQAFLRRFAKFEQGVPSRGAFPRLSGIPGCERLPRALARLTAERGRGPDPTCL